jgi:uncharacterized membrane protein
MKTLRNLNWNKERNGYVVAVTIALIIASVMLGAYYFVLRPQSEGYMTIYVLDSQHMAGNYPERLQIGVNSTFSVYVDVENHRGSTQNCSVLVKTVQNMNSSFPLYGVTPKPTFNDLVDDGATWESPATISLDQPGNYMVVFELWTTNSETGQLEWSGDFTVFNLKVT